MLSVTNLSIRLRTAPSKEMLIGLNDDQDSGLSFDVAAGEVLSIMGPSGSGKSTLLNWLIGALPDSFEAKGELSLDKRLLNDLTTQERQVGILFQNDMLFPHLSVGANLAFAVPSIAKGEVKSGEVVDKHQRKKLIEEALSDAGMEGFYARDPATLSGGQRARVSALQSLMAEPKALLLDEPFSRLDKDRRQQFREFVYQRITALNIPAILVTHDDEDVPSSPTLGRVITLKGK